MDTFSLRLFLRIADLGTVSAAARDLSLSQASASARLARLEETVGFRLFNRTTRAVRLTSDGREFLPYAQHIVETLDTGLDAISGAGTGVKGQLRMTMPGSFGRMHIIPYLAEFEALYPDVSLDLRLSDEVLNVVEGAYDLIIRIAQLEDSGLIARKLTSDHRLLAASPKYIDRYGMPKSPENLTEHKCIVLAHLDKWRFEEFGTVTVPRSFAANDAEVLRSMVLQGMGISPMSVWLGSEFFRSGQLIHVLPDFHLAFESAIWALYPSGRIVAPKVRAMIDFLLQKFDTVPPWERHEN